MAAKLGYKAAAKKAGAIILEPIMKNEVVTPEENMGDIVGDLNRRRGQVNNMSDRSGAKVIKAEVPLAEMFGYVTTLRTLSSGRATSTMEFSHYAETPSNISEEVIKAAKAAGYTITTGLYVNDARVSTDYATANFFFFTVDTDTATKGGVIGGGNGCSVGPVTLSA